MCDGNVGDSGVAEVADYIVFAGAPGRKEIARADRGVDEAEQFRTSLLPASAIEDHGEFALMGGAGPGLTGRHEVTVDQQERRLGKCGLVHARGWYVDAERIGGDDVAFTTAVDGDRR